jgi:TPR repeat protein
MSKSDIQTSLVAVQSTALTKAGAASLVARGRADLRINEEAEEWLKKGCELRDQERYEEAIACFERGIELNPNHSVIQFMLGLSFGNGIGAPLDKVTARAWYRKAAEQGLKEAQYNLGLMYEGWSDGPGLLANYEQAGYWIRKAAEQGYERAKYRLKVG